MCTPLSEWVRERKRQKESYLDGRLKIKGKKNEIKVAELHKELFLFFISFRQDTRFFP
jgi:hypothetical protein